MTVFSLTPDLIEALLDLIWYWFEWLEFVFKILKNCKNSHFQLMNQKLIFAPVCDSVQRNRIWSNKNIARRLACNCISSNVFFMHVWLFYWGYWRCLLFYLCVSLFRTLFIASLIRETLGKKLFNENDETLLCLRII